MNCSNCKFWFTEGFRLAKNGNTSTDDKKNEPAGTCRRYAPSARTNNWRSWPVTVGSDFCHDHQPAPTPPTPPPPPPVEKKPLFNRSKKTG